MPTQTSFSRLPQSKETFPHNKVTNIMIIKELRMYYPINLFAFSAMPQLLSQEQTDYTN